MELEKLKRRELISLCKKHGFKANGKVNKCLL